MVTYSTVVPSALIFHLTLSKIINCLRVEAVSYPQKPNVKQSGQTASLHRSQIFPSPLPPSSIHPSLFHPPDLTREEILNKLNNNYATTMHISRLLHSGYWGCPGEQRQTRVPARKEHPWQRTSICKWVTGPQPVQRKLHLLTAREP